MTQNTFQFMVFSETTVLTLRFFAKPTSYYRCGNGKIFMVIDTGFDGRVTNSIHWMRLLVFEHECRSLSPFYGFQVCAHRYIHKGQDFRWGLGLCHFLTSDLEYSQTLVPCRHKQRRALEDYGYCQAGTAVDILEDDTALFGAPGAFTCRGMMFRISVSDDYLSMDRKHYHSPLLEMSPSEKYSYLGMSVAGGKFFGDHWSYVSGAPKDALGTGRILFFRQV